MKRLTDGEREILAEQERDAEPVAWTDADILAFEAWYAAMNPERPVVPTGADEGGGTDQYPF
jgi:hypothetical protein